jgi:hypothetical protein
VEGKVKGSCATDYQPVIKAILFGVVNAVKVKVVDFPCNSFQDFILLFSIAVFNEAAQTHYLPGSLEYEADYINEI